MTDVSRRGFFRRVGGAALGAAVAPVAAKAMESKVFESEAADEFSEKIVVSTSVEVHSLGTRISAVVKK